MKTQQDTKMRVVALSNLEAMCKHISGMCHRFEVSKITPNRVHVEYSNPDEWGNTHPMTAVFPAWQTKGWNHQGHDHYVTLHILDVYRDNMDGEGWQCFQQLLDCPELFRSSPNLNDWHTQEQWRKIRAEATPPAVKA